VTYDPDSDDAGGDWCDRLFAPPASFLTTGNLSSLAIDEPAPALGDGDHCREMAGKLRQLARYTKSPGIRRELPITPASAVSTDTYACAEKERVSSHVTLSAGGRRIRTIGPWRQALP
jgi:hypothetical protein